MVAGRLDAIDGDSDVVHGVALGGIEFCDINFKWTELLSGSILLHMLEVFETCQSVECILEGGLDVEVADCDVD